MLVLDATALKACKISRFEKVCTFVFPPFLWPGALQGLEEKPWAASSQLTRPSLFVPPQHLYNAAAFKARTKARSRVRDKRADIL